MENYKRHILILTPGFPKDDEDFNCIPPLQELLQKFISTYPSVKISVIAFQYPYFKEKYLWKALEIIPMNGRNSLIKKPFVWLNAIRESKKINSKLKINSVHSLWLGECALIGNYLSKKFGGQHICTLMGQDVKSSNKYLGLLKESKTKFIALSKNQAELFFEIAKRKVDNIIHWGLDDQMIKSEFRDIDLLGVGSLIPLKNYSLFINTAEEIVKSIPDLKCVLVGSGPESEKLKAIADEKGLNKNIEFTGLLDRKKIFELMQRSKVFVHPSQFEGSGFVFAEALVNGMHIVSFNVGYAHEHSKWSIAKDEKDFIRITKDLLSRQLIFESTNLYPLKETVSKYFELYNS